MIVNFYKKVGANKQRKYVPITTKNIECVPQKEMIIRFLGQFFVVERVCFDVDICEYHVYTKRI